MSGRHAALRAGVWVVLMILAGPAHSWAAEVCAIPSVTDAAGAIAQFDDLRHHDCLGGAQCATIACKQVTELLKNAGAAVPPAKMQSTLGTLVDAAAALSETQPGVLQLHGMLMRWRLRELSKTDPQSAVTQILASNTKEWQGQNFLIFPNTPFEVDIQDVLGRCASPVTCEAGFVALVDVYSLSDLIDRTLKTATQSPLDAFGDHIHQLDARWTAFHDKSLAVLPWELAFNNLFYRSSNAGFSGPPSYQWLVLHPSAALVYDTRQSSKFQPALLLDLVGRYQWSWGGRDGSDVKSPWGAALAMSWHGNGPGFGLSVHLPRNWSLGLTTSRTGSKGNQVQLIVSSEVARFVTDKEQTTQNLRQTLEKLE